MNASATFVPTLARAAGRSRKRDLVTVSDIVDDLSGLLGRAHDWKVNRRLGVPVRPLQDQAVALIFEEPSLRSHSSFELAVHELGGHAVLLPAANGPLGRSPTIGDTARVLSRFYAALVYRAHRWQDGEELARSASVPVINAGDDREHPCRTVADLLTLSERWNGRFAGRTLAYVGDGNHVLRSLALGCAAVGLDLVAAIPEGYRPSTEFLALVRRTAARSGAAFHIESEPRDAVRHADAVYTDAWVPRGDEAQAAARMRAFEGFTLDSALLDAARPGAFAMHGRPAHRGVEISDAVMDGPRQAVWDQAENRLHAQKAILELLLASPTPLPSKGTG